MWSIMGRNAATVPASTDRAAVMRARSSSAGVDVPSSIGKAELGVGAAVDLAEQSPVLRQPDGFVPVLPPGELRLQARRGHDRDVVCSRALGEEPEHGGGRVAEFASDGLELWFGFIHLRDVRQLGLTCAVNSSYQGR